jgi:hypothetical protein
VLCSSTGDRHPFICAHTLLLSLPAHMLQTPPTGDPSDPFLWQDERGNWHILSHTYTHARGRRPAQHNQRAAISSLVTSTGRGMSRRRSHTRMWYPTPTAPNRRPRQWSSPSSSSTLHSHQRRLARLPVQQLRRRPARAGLVLLVQDHDRPGLRHVHADAAPRPRGVRRYI